MFTYNDFYSLLLLVFLELILGVDNLIFNSLIISKLTKHKELVRFVGLLLALLLRILFLSVWTQVLRLSKYLIFYNFSLKDILLILGGIFLIYHSIKEIVNAFIPKNESLNFKSTLSSSSAVIQITFIDFIFSLDSILTAVAITKHIYIIIIAFTLSMLVMLLSSKFCIKYLNAFPNLKNLALCFIILVGTLLISEGFHYNIGSEYLYFAFVFSLIVEILNIFLSYNKTVIKNGK